MYRWAIVDTETTGLQISHDTITEIAIVIRSEQGIEHTWHTLINPKRPLPYEISALTGITTSMLEDAPCFEDIALELLALLQDTVLVAHNARFDYGFLKNAFKSINIPFKIPVLCTIKLFKKLYPDLKSYALHELTQKFDLPLIQHHRAMHDVTALNLLLDKGINEHGLENVLHQAKICYSKSSIPSRLTTDLQTIPQSYGVYLFYSGNSDVPLYIGKSINLRQRVLSHFQSDFTTSAEFKMAQQVERVEWIPTAGELSALLLEASLIKEKMPIFNKRLRRKKAMVGFKVQKRNQYLHIELIKLSDENENSVYGAFNSITHAKKVLLAIVKEYQLCPKLCGLEKSNNACFSFQLKRCFGACIHLEKAEIYNERLFKAMQKFASPPWPYTTVAFKESCSVNQLSHYLLFRDWKFLGFTPTLCTLDKIEPINHAVPQDRDTYKILQQFFRDKISSGDLVEVL